MASPAGLTSYISCGLQKRPRRAENSKTLVKQEVPPFTENMGKKTEAIKLNCLKGKKGLLSRLIN